MAKTARLADGTTLSFPDETPLEVVDRVVAEHVAGKQGVTPTPAPIAPLADAAGEFTTGGVAAGSQPAPNTQVAPSTRPQTNFPVTIGAKELFKEEIEKAPWYEKAVAGAGSAPAMGYQSVKQLMGGEVAPEDIEAQRAIADTGPGMAGNLAGNVAMLAVPGGAGIKAMQGANVTKAILPEALAGLSKVDRLRRFAAPAVQAGGEAAVLAPTLEGEDRAENAAKAAFFTKALQGVGRLASGVVEPTKQALKLMKEGINPTVSQSSHQGSLLGYAEELMGSLPFAGKYFRKGGERAENEAVEALSLRGEPPPVPGKAASRPPIPDAEDLTARGKFFTDRQEGFDAAYDNVLTKKVIPVSQAFRADVRAGADEFIEGVPGYMQRKFEADMKRFIPEHSGRISGESWKDIQNNVRQRAREYYAGAQKSGRSEDKAMGDAYSAVDDALLKIRNKGLSKEEVKTLEGIDEAYANNQILIHAANYKRQLGEGGSVGIQNIIDAVEANTPTWMKVQTKGRMQDITEPGKEVFAKDKSDVLMRKLGYLMSGAVLGTGAAVGGPLIGLPALAALAAGGVGSTKTGSKLLMGLTEKQRALADLLRSPGVRGAIAADTGTEAQRD